MVTRPRSRPRPVKSVFGQSCDQDISLDLLSLHAPHLQSIPEDKALLGVLMHRIRVSAATRDKWEVKALANGCRVLARTGKEEYLPFLQDIVVRAKGGDVGDYAEDAAETLAELMEEKGERT